MKKLGKLIILSIACLFMACSGSDYDDSGLWSQVNQNTSRIEALESQVEKLNSDLASINTIVNALNGGKTISQVVEITDGYTIFFSDGQSITISNGKDGVSAPTIGVDKYNGTYYWTITIDGKTSWLLDNDGNKLQVNGNDGTNGTNGKDGKDGADGVTPLIRVSSTGYWEVSYNNGSSYSFIYDVNGNKIKAVAESSGSTTSYFSDITYTDTEVTFILSNGTKFVVPRETEFTINFSSYVVELVDGEQTLSFDIEGFDSNTFVECCAHGNIKANVAYNRGNQFGQISVTATGTIDDNTKLVVFLCNKRKTITKVITFYAVQDDRIDDVVPTEIQDSIGEWITIYRGTTPPNIEGCYVMDEPQVVHCQDVGNGGYADGATGFNDMYIKFSNQDTKNNTLDYNEKEGTAESSGKGAFISGSGNYFTAYFDTEGKTSGIYVKTALVISGEKTSSGIKNLRYAFIMVDKGSDPNNVIMKKGVYRIFRDKDELASKTTWPGSTETRAHFDFTKSIWSSNKTK